MYKVELEINIYKCDIFYFYIEKLEDISQLVELYKIKTLPLKISTEIPINMFFPAV